MSLVNTFRSVEQEVARLTAHLEKLKTSPELQREVEFDEKLRALMAEHGKSLPDIVAILSPIESAPVAGRRAAARPAGSRSPAKERTFNNPHTGESVTLVKTNNRTYRAWVAEYGEDKVAGWEVK